MRGIFLQAVLVRFHALCYPEYHQPGDVEIRFEKSVNERTKNKKIAAELAKAKDNNDKHKANSPVRNENEFLETINEEEGDNQTKIIHFFTNDPTEEDDDAVSSQEMIEDARTRRVLGSKSLHCDHCDLETRSATFLKRHMRIKHVEDIQCEQCEYKTNSKNDIEKHISRAHEDLDQETSQSVTQNTLNIRERITCKECNYKTTSECVMKRHIELKHEDKKAVTASKRRTCDICSKKFNKEHTFKTHMETIHAGNMNNNLNSNSQQPRGTLASNTIQKKVSHFSSHQ